MVIGSGESRGLEKPADGSDPGRACQVKGKTACQLWRTLRGQQTACMALQQPVSSPGKGGEEEELPWRNACHCSSAPISERMSGQHC